MCYTYREISGADKGVALTLGVGRSGERACGDKASDACSELFEGTSKSVGHEVSNTGVDSGGGRSVVPGPSETPWRHGDVIKWRRAPTDTHTIGHCASHHEFFGRCD